MARKTFKEKTEHLDRFFTEPDETELQETVRTHETHKTQTQKYYRLNLKLKAEHKEYLSLASARARKSITEYINGLIAADKVKNQIWDTWDT